MEKFFKNDLPDIPCYSHTPLIMQGNYSSKFDKKSMLDPSVDIAMFFASPLVKEVGGKLVSTRFQEVNYLADLSRIKKRLMKNQDSIEITVHQGTKADLITEMSKKIRILHLFCNVEVQG